MKSVLTRGVVAALMMPLICSPALADPPAPAPRRHQPDLVANRPQLPRPLRHLGCRTARSHPRPQPVQVPGPRDQRDRAIGSDWQRGPDLVAHISGYLLHSRGEPDAVLAHREARAFLKE